MPATTSVTCPECQANLRIPATIPAGKKIRCPKCQATFVVNPEAEEASPEVVEQVAARPKAGPRRQPPREDTDKEDAHFQAAGKNPKGGPMDVEGDEPRSGRQPARKSRAFEEDEEDLPPRRKEQKPPRGSPVLLWSLILGGALVLIGGGAAVYFFVLKKAEDASVSKGLPNQKGPGIAPGPAKPPAGWVADQALLDQLAPAVTLQGVRFQPPKGYFVERSPLGGGGTKFFWKGPRRPDQSIPNFLMSVLTLGPNRPSLDQAFNIQLAGFRNSIKTLFTNITTSPVEHGQINGQDFVRSRLSLSNADGSVKMQGFAYMTLHGAKGYLFMSTEKEQNSASLKVHEAAVCTFRKGPGNSQGPPKGWIPEPAVLGSLGEEMNIKGWRIRPPAGYLLAQKPVAGTGTQYQWKGPPRPDKSVPNLVMSVFDAGANKPSLDAAFNIQLSVVKKSMQALFPTITTSPIEHGQINGLNFVRTRLHMTNADGSVKLQGFAYLTIQGPDACFFMSVDKEQNAQTLKVHEGTVCTFNKQ